MCNQINCLEKCYNRGNFFNESSSLFSPESHLATWNHWKTMLDRALLHLKFLKNWQQNWQQICLFWFGSRRRLVTGAWRRFITKRNKFAVKFPRNFRWRRALSSKVFHWFHEAKCYSELKIKELSWRKLPPKLFGKLSYVYGLFRSLEHARLTAIKSAFRLDIIQSTPLCQNKFGPRKSNLYPLLFKKNPFITYKQYFFWIHHFCKTELADTQYRTEVKPMSPMFVDVIATRTEVKSMSPMFVDVIAPQKTNARYSSM